MKLKEFAEFYRQLARLVESGLPIAEVLTSEIFPDFPRLQLVQQAVFQGQSLAKAFERAGVLPNRDLMLIAAAEQSGRLPSLLKSLSLRYAEKAEAVVAIKKKLVYPAFLLFMASTVLPLPQLILGRLTFSGFLFQALSTWGALLLAGFTIYYLARNIAINPTWAGSNRWAIRRLPLVGKFMASWYLEDYFTTLATMIGAGVPLGLATDRAAQTVSSAYLKKQLISCHDKLTAGRPLSEAYAQLPFLKKEHQLRLRSAEKTGVLDESFEQIAEDFRDKNRNQIEIFGAVLPKVVYFAVVIYVAAGIISHYVGYFDMLEKMTETI